MTLNQLKYAIIVAESESFNEAAKKLFISQPSLSTSIHSLEEEIGVQIFRRSQNGIAVTPEGKEFIGYARQVMEQYELLDARYITKSEVKKRFSVSMQHYSLRLMLLCIWLSSMVWTNMSLLYTKPRHMRL